MLVGQIDPIIRSRVRKTQGVAPADQGWQSLITESRSNFDAAIFNPTATLKIWNIEPELSQPLPISS